MAARGFRPWGPVLSTKAYAVDSSDSHVTYIGDMMQYTIAGGGYITSAAVGATAVVGPSLTFLTASVSGSPLIADDPDQRLITTNDNATSNVAVVADIGNTGDWTLATAGSLTTKYSGMELDTSTLAGTAAAGALEVIGYPTGPGVLGIGVSSSPVIVAPSGEYARRATTGVA